MKKQTKLLALVAMFIAAIVPSSFAQIVVPSDGSDGALNITTNTVIDLSQAVTGSWSANNSANAGRGIYDPTVWAVVFKYSSVTIASNATITFNNHPSTAPVVWLVSGNVTQRTNEQLVEMAENQKMREMELMQTLLADAKPASMDYNAEFTARENEIEQAEKRKAVIPVNQNLLAHLATEPPAPLKEQPAAVTPVVEESIPATTQPLKEAPAKTIAQMAKPGPIAAEDLNASNDE